MLLGGAQFALYLAPFGRVVAPRKLDARLLDLLFYAHLFASYFMEDRGLPGGGRAGPEIAKAVMG